MSQHSTNSGSSESGFDPGSYVTLENFSTGCKLGFGAIVAKNVYYATKAGLNALGEAVSSDEKNKEWYRETKTEAWSGVVDHWKRDVILASGLILTAYVTDTYAIPTVKKGADLYKKINNLTGKATNLADRGTKLLEDLHNPKTKENIQKGSEALHNILRAAGGPQTQPVTPAASATDTASNAPTTPTKPSLYERAFEEPVAVAKEVGKAVDVVQDILNVADGMLDKVNERAPVIVQAVENLGNVLGALDASQDKIVGGLDATKRITSIYSSNSATEALSAATTQAPLAPAPALSKIEMLQQQQKLLEEIGRTLDAAQPALKTLATPFYGETAPKGLENLGRVLEPVDQRFVNGLRTIHAISHAGRTESPDTCTNTAPLPFQSAPERALNTWESNAKNLRELTNSNVFGEATTALDAAQPALEELANPVWGEKGPAAVNNVGDILQAVHNNQDKFKAGIDAAGLLKSAAEQAGLIPPSDSATTTPTTNPLPALSVPTDPIAKGADSLRNINNNGLFQEAAKTAQSARSFFTLAADEKCAADTIQTIKNAASVGQTLKDNAPNLIKGVETAGEVLDAVRPLLNTLGIKASTGGEAATVAARDGIATRSPLDRVVAEMPKVKEILAFTADLEIADNLVGSVQTIGRIATALNNAGAPVKELLHNANPLLQALKDQGLLTTTSSQPAAPASVDADTLRSSMSTTNTQLPADQAIKLALQSNNPELRKMALEAIRKGLETTEKTLNTYKEKQELIDSQLEWCAKSPTTCATLISTAKAGASAYSSAAEATSSVLQFGKSVGNSVVSAPTGLTNGAMDYVVTPLSNLVGKLGDVTSDFGSFFSAMLFGSANTPPPPSGTELFGDVNGTVNGFVHLNGAMNGSGTMSSYHNTTPQAVYSQQPFP